MNWAGDLQLWKFANCSSVCSAACLLQGGAGDYRSLAKRVFDFALRCPGSWAHVVSNTLQSCGGLLPTAFGVVPGGHTAQRRLRRLVIQPLLQCEAHSQYRSEVAAVPSLSPFFQYQPHLLRARHVHAGRSSGVDACSLWTPSLSRWAQCPSFCSRCSSAPLLVRLSAMTIVTRPPGSPPVS